MPEAPALDAWLKSCLRSKDKSGQRDAVLWFNVAIQLNDAIKCHTFEGWQCELMGQCVEPDEHKEPVHDLVTDCDEDTKPSLGVRFGSFGEILLYDFEARCRIAHEREEGSAAVKIIW